MKRKNNTVNPKAGTLKLTQDSVFRNISVLSSKLIAFCVILVISLFNQSFTQDTDMLSEPAVTIDTTDKLASADSCCLVPVNGTMHAAMQGKKSVIVHAPQVKQLEISDREVHANLMSSLRESRVLAMMPQMAVADTEISTRFVAETRIRTADPRPSKGADHQMDLQFAAENLATVSTSHWVATDAEQNYNFLQGQSLTQFPIYSKFADKEIAGNFYRDQQIIVLPSSGAMAKADMEIDQMSQLDHSEVTFIKRGTAYGK